MMYTIFNCPTYVGQKSKGENKMRKKFMKVLTALTITTVMTSGAMAASAAESSYTTKQGDNLSKIAQEVYGDAHNWRVIYERNKDQIKNPDLIWSNQTLILPDLGNVTIEQQTPANEEQAAASTVDTTVPTDTTADIVANNVTDASAFMQNVYNLMAAKNYAAMSEVAISDEAESFVNAMTNDHTIYIPDGSLTGTGAGVYRDERGYYYFYYGEYVNGVRTGNGVNFLTFSNAYEYYEGMWSNDLPNGQGTVTTIEDNGRISIFSGNLANGLWNGTVNIAYTDIYGGTYNFNFVADNGVATEDKTDEYLSHVKYLGYSREDVVPENRIIFAFDGHTNGGVENGVEQYYDDANICYYCTPGTHLGVTVWEY